MTPDELDQRFSEVVNALVKILRERRLDPNSSIRAMPGRKISCSLSPVVADGWTTWPVSAEMLAGTAPAEVARQLMTAWDATLERLRQTGRPGTSPAAQ